MSALPVSPSNPASQEGSPLRETVVEFLRLAVSVCDARFAVARIINQAPIATEATAPLEKEVVVAESALRSDKPMVTFGSYSAVKLAGHRGRIWGTMGVGGVHADDVGQRLIAIGRQLTRWLELTETARVWKEKAELYGPLVEEAVVAVYSIRNGRFSYVNQKFADTLGYTKEEILAFASFAEIVAEDERDRVREIVRSRQAGEHRDLRYVTRICRRDGTLIDAEVHGSVADVEGDRLVIGAAVDVTARETADKLIREREEFLRVLTDNIADVVLIVDARGIVTYISGSIENVLGYTVAERQGKEAFDTIHPEDRSALAAHLNACAGSDRLDRAEYRFRHKNGSWRVLQLHGTNLLDHPHIRGWLITAADVTDRRRLEQELEQLNRLTSLGRLSAQVAHEFNNVMMGIQTPVDLIRRRTTDDPQMSRYTDMIAASISRGKRVTGDILRFGRPAQLSLRSVEVQDLLRRAADEIRPLLTEGTQLYVELPPTALHVHADASQLSQVLINLCLNARDAMQGKTGTLTIGARPGHEHTARSVGNIPNSHEFVHINVSDTGEGINSEDLPYIFEPLFTTKKTGTGLCLSVVYQVITGHGGHIFVDTKRGEGTTFHLFIPATLEHHADVAEEMQTESTHRPKPRVLIVDDEVAITTGLRWILEAEGMTVHIVALAADVLPAIEAFNPDVMLLDLLLPDGDGRAVYEQVDGQLPVIFSTGSLGERDLVASGHDNVAVLVKPYTTDDLLRAIYQVLSCGENDG